MPDNLLTDDDISTARLIKKEEEDDDRTLSKADRKKLKKEKRKKEERRVRERKKYKLFVPEDVDLYPFLACDGMCSFDVNLGSQIFHCSHDDFNKGLLQ
jgi:hypothetical protein